MVNEKCLVIFCDKLLHITINMDFIVDTVGDENLQVKTELLDADEVTYDVGKDARLHSILQIFHKKRTELDNQSKTEEDVQKKLSNLHIDNLFDDFFSEMGWTGTPRNKSLKKEKKKMFHFDQLDHETGKLKSTLGAVDVEKEMKMSVLQPGIEQEHSLPQYDKSEKKLKAERKKEREKTKGPGWFNMAAPELTDEVKNDLQVLKMRSVMDPKHFYKKNDMEVLPKYFQVGRIVDSSLDHQNERLTKKERKRTMVDELLADAEFQKYNKRKYKEIIEDKRKSEYRTFMKDKRQKRKSEVKKDKTANKKKKNVGQG